MQRILILGGPGAGKTTLAIRLAEMTGLTVLFSDQALWTAGWEVIPHETRKVLVRMATAEDRWIMDGCLGAVLPEVAARADQIVLLDIAVPLRLSRMLWRQVRYFGRVRPGAPDGCRERISFRDLRNAASYQQRWAAPLAEVHRTHAEKLVTLKGHGAVVDWLAQQVVHAG